MIKRYRLIKEYPNHKIGDMAYLAPEVSDTRFIWEGKTESLETILVPKDFQPDITPEWFEEIKYVFITEDNVEIYEGYLYWTTEAKSQYPIGYKAVSMGRAGKYSQKFPNILYFSTEQAAWNYIGNHQKRYRYTTEDNVKLYEGDPYVCVYKRNLKPYENFQVNYMSEGGSIDTSYLFFSTKEAAQTYIAMNKLLFSVEDIRRLCSNNFPLNKFIIEAKLKLEY